MSALLKALCLSQNQRLNSLLMPIPARSGQINVLTVENTTVVFWTWEMDTRIVIAQIGTFMGMITCPCDASEMGVGPGSQW